MGEFLWEVVEAGTPDYMAPEMIDPPHYHDNSADWWSLGVLMFDTWTELARFPGDFLGETSEMPYFEGRSIGLPAILLFAVNSDTMLLTHAHFALTSYNMLTCFPS